jgi:nucleoside-diphosphate-sugar epimerase
MFAGKKVVVTGGAGFVGKYLVELLVADGAKVVVLDNFSRGSNIVAGANYVRADAGEPNACLTAFKDASAVFNLAAWVAGVIYNQGHHAEMFEKNIRLLTVPTICASEQRVPFFLQTSSVCVYAPDYGANAEEANGHTGTPVQANIGYSMAKRMGEYMASWASGIERVAIVRPSNLFGPLDYFDERAHVIPALIKKALHDDRVVLHGSGAERREFLYVTDVAAGMYAAAANAPQGVSTYNLGTGGWTATSILKLARIICELCGYPDKPIDTTPDSDGGDAIRSSKAEKAYHELGWRYEVDLEEGLQKTIEWYRHVQRV